MCITIYRNASFDNPSIAAVPGSGGARLRPCRTGPSHRRWTSPPTRPEQPGRRTLTVELSTVTVVTVLGAITVLLALMWLARSAPSSLTLIAVGAFAALALDPVVNATRRVLHIPRGWAAATVLLLLTVATVAFLSIVGPDLARQTTELPDQIPQVIDSLVDLPIIGTTLASNDVPARVEDFLGTLPERVAGPTPTWPAWSSPSAPASSRRCSLSP